MIVRGSATAALIGLAWLAAGHANGQTAQPRVKIGLIEPMSGNLSAYGAEEYPAFRHAIEQVNKAGGIRSLGGAKLEIVFADDSSQPARTAIEGRRLVEEGAVVLTGALLTPHMGALAPVIDELKVPTLSFWGGSSRSNYLYTLGFPYDRGFAGTMAGFITFLAKEHQFPIKRIATAYANYEAGQQVNQALVSRLTAEGFEIVGQVPLDMNASDDTAVMTRLRSLRPDVVVGLISTKDGILLHQARYNLGFNSAIFIGGTGGYSDPALWDQLGPTVAPAVLTRNLFGMTGYSDDVKLPAAQRLKSQLQPEAKAPIGQSTFQAAQAAAIIVRALEKAGARDPEKIRAALAETDIEPGAADQFIPRREGLSFGPDRMLKDSTALIIQWTPDRKQQVVYPSAFASTPPRPKS